MAIRNRTAPFLTVKLQTNRNEDFRIVSDKILRFSYTDSERKADKCKITVDNADLENFDDPAWIKGATIKVSWGYPGAMSPERVCIITAVKGFRELEVEAKAKSIVMNRVSKSTVYENKKISQIVQEIAAANGFSGDQAIIDDTGDVLESVYQGNLTDAQFIRRWASRLGFEFYVDHDGFHFHERRLGERPIRVLRYFTGERGDFIGDPSIENDITAKPGRVKIKGRDPIEKKDHDAEADNKSDSERDSLTKFLAAIDPESGDKHISQGTIGSEQTVIAADASPEVAKKRAKARFRRAQQVAVKMSANIIGDPLLFAKSIVQVEGMGKRLSVKYYVKEVTHDLSPSGYECPIKLVSDGHGGHSTESKAAIGLSALNVGQRKAGGSSKGIRSEIIDSIREITLGLKNKGLNKQASMAEQAGELYLKQGNRASVEISRAMISIARSTKESFPEASNEAMQVASSLRNEQQETESGGKVNNKKAETDDEKLEPVNKVDPETGEKRTRFESKKRK